MPEFSETTGRQVFGSGIAAKETDHGIELYIWTAGKFPDEYGTVKILATNTQLLDLAHWISDRLEPF